MMDLNQKVEALTRDLGLELDVINERKTFLELTEDDEMRLRRAHDLLNGESADFADAFYKHLLSFDALRPFLEGGDRLERLKSVQTKYFNRLTAGTYDADYVRDRLRVGLVHQRIGLEPTWYLGAYRKYLSEMQRRLWNSLGDEPDEFLKTCDALTKVVNFDIGLALDTYFHASTEAIYEHKEYAESLVEAIPSGLMVVDRNLKILSMNPAMRMMLDDQGHCSATTDQDIPCLIKSALLNNACYEVIESGKNQSNIFVTLNRTNDRGKLDFSLSRIQFRGTPLLLVMAQDVTEKFRVETELAQSEERYRRTFNHAAVGLAQTDIDGRITRINTKLCNILGYEEDELLGMRFPQLTHPEDRIDAHVMTTRVLDGELESYSKERRYQHKDGRVIWTNATVSCLHENNARNGLIVVLEDISARKHMEEELVRMAGHDALTGLPNRALLQDRLEKALARARRNEQQVAVMYLDLDRFKYINDSQGHATGDKMLIEAGKRLMQVVRETDTVARLGGDEFVVILDGIEDSRAVTIRAQAILRALAAPFAIKNLEVYTGASIGVALYPKDGENADTLLTHADSAMYQAKDAGRNNVQFYTPELNAEHIKRLDIANGLRQAIANNELELHYQPKVKTECGKMVGVEALLRWTRADGSKVFPDQFIPIAEDSGMILGIGEWVLRQACRDVVKWRELSNQKPFRVSVNLSAKQFKHQDIVQVVQNTLRDTGCPAEALELEITESVLMERPEKVTEVLQKLQEMGIRLSIDDFGTGYSSLSYLRNFPIHELKIDRSFIEDIEHVESHSAIVNAIISLAHSLKLKVLAEGVETRQQLEYLQGQNCDHIQGYLFSRPVTASQIDEMLTASCVQ